MIFIGHAQQSSFRNHDSTNLDFAINDVGINQYLQIKKYLGEDVLKEIDSNILKPDWVHAVVINKKRTEYFKLVLWEGSECCQYFEIGYNTSKISQKKIPCNYDHFVSNNGIKLGVSFAKFKKIFPLSRFAKKSMGKFVIYTFSIIDEESTRFRKKPIYSYVSQYVFLDNRLLKFGFGNIFMIPDTN